MNKWKNQKKKKRKKHIDTENRVVITQEEKL